MSNQEVFCPEQIAHNHTAMHIKGDSMANQLMPHLEGQVFEEGACVLSIGKAAEQAQGISLTAPNAPTCQQLGYCILNR